MFKHQERSASLGTVLLKAICLGVRSEAGRKYKTRERVRIKEDKGRVGSFEFYLEKNSRKTQKRNDIKRKPRA